MPVDAELPPTCNVLGLIAFGPGWHKDAIYTPEMNDRIPVNFRKLDGHTIPRAKIEGGQPGAKIGHDKEQLIAERLKLSMGFLSVGKITRCEQVPGYPGYIELDIRGVPTRAVGQEIAADRLPGTSVELLPELPDPDNPSLTIKGPILTGIAFLGEEQPAVRNWPAELRERAKPKATFEDGSPVPPNGDIPQEWLDAQSDVSQVMADRLGAEFSASRRTVRYRGREFSDRTLCFADLSEVTTMEPKAQLETLGLTPEQLEKVLAIIASNAPEPMAATPASVGGGAGGNPPAPMSDKAKVYADGGPLGAVKDAVGMSEDEMSLKKCMAMGEDPKATPEQKMMAAFASSVVKKFGELEKQVGAQNKFAEEIQKKDEEAKMAAFSAACGEKVKKLRTKLPPEFIDRVITPAIADIGRAKTFASETDRVAAFSALVERYESMPDDPRLKATPRPVDANGKPALTPGQLESLNTEAMRRSALGGLVRSQLLPK